MFIEVINWEKKFLDLVITKQHAYSLRYWEHMDVHVAKIKYGTEKVQALFSTNMKFRGS